MAKRKTPQQLREEAKKLMEQAKAEEDARYREIGKIFVDYLEKGFVEFEMNTFKSQALRIWKG